MSITKNQQKIISSLSQKKYRQKHQLFVAEGVKVVNELLASSFTVKAIFATNDFDCKAHEALITRISTTELQKISQLKKPNKVVALFKIPEHQPIKVNKLTIVLDAINDPGNLGTIIRLCDWFGVHQIICSEDTVDCFNAKVVQASMGSLPRVVIQYTDLSKFLNETQLPVFIADMNGENIYKTTLPAEAILVFGNEANGVSQTIKEQVNRVLSIPRFGDMQQTESLNVATATAILLSEFKRSC